MQHPWAKWSLGIVMGAALALSAGCEEPTDTVGRRDGVGTEEGVGVDAEEVPARAETLDLQGDAGFATTVLQDEEVLQGGGPLEEERVFRDRPEREPDVEEQGRAGDGAEPEPERAGAEAEGQPALETAPEEGADLYEER